MRAALARSPTSAPSWLLAGLTLAAYLPALQCGFIWDDDDYVTANSTLLTLDGLWRIWFEFGATPQYYPLVHTSYWLEYRVWGLNPFGYHLTNIALHAGVAVAFYLLLRRLGLRVAWWVAAVFALHPVHVESVAWITERKNVLSGLCYTLAAHCYLSFALGEPEARSRRAYAGFLLLFAAALLAKTVTVSLPATLLLVLWWHRRQVLRQGLLRRDVLPLLPAFALGIPLALLTIWLEKHHVGARGPEWDFSLVDRCLIAGRALWFYAGSLVWPQDLTFFYPRWNIDAAAWWQYLFPAGFAAALAGAWLARRRLGVGALAALLVFAGTLTPALGFFDVYPMRFSFVADHFQYHASMALLVLLVATLEHARRRWLPSAGRPAAAAGVVLLCVFAALTWRQCGVYRDLETLWRHTVTNNPESAAAHTNLGQLLFERGDIEAAFEHYRTAERLSPDDPLVHYDLGVALQAAGHSDQARAHYEATLKLDPDHSAALNNLGSWHTDAGNFAAAIEYFRRAMALDPDFSVLHFNLATAFDRQGDTTRAAQHYRRAIELSPGDAKPHVNLGGLLMRTGEKARAVEHFRAAVDLLPGDTGALLNLANALFVQRATDRAATCYRQLLELDPDHADAHNNLGILLSGRGDRAQAIHHFREALRVNPEFSQARRNLADALKQQ